MDPGRSTAARGTCESDAPRLPGLRRSSAAYTRLRRARRCLRSCASSAGGTATSCVRRVNRQWRASGRSVRRPESSRCEVSAWLGWSRSIAQHGPECVPSRVEQSIDVGVGMRVRDVAALQVERQLEDAALHLRPPVAGEERYIIREQVVVTRYWAVEKIRDEHGTEAAHHRRNVELWQDI